ncbi:MAG: hypothetical protein KJ623_02185 [Nanoarchaeota archaeon]|nr:hypothetical protein [Nanoarchaeota archaeon]MBU0963136.1 hypothetical protein [Nanoarchaeota archaeon]
MNNIEDDIKRFILRKLVRHKIWMHKHTNIHNLPKGLPDYLRSKKEVKEVIEELLKNKILLSKPTNYGLEVSLNIEKKKEIEDFIEGK